MDLVTKTHVRNDWARARRNALWGAVVDVLTQRPGELLPLDEIKTRLSLKASHYLGLQQVPLDKIIGSEGRYSDFDRRFLPRRDTTAERWMSISQAQLQDKPLPPVELYKVGDIYFVKDGNHRVSVARQRGQIDIDAYVTEYEVDVPLDPSTSMRNLILKEEYSDFLDWTQLARLRPEQRLELSALGGYLELINHINTHRYYRALERNGPVSAEEAVTSWYDNVYRPVVEAIRNHHILSHFPGRTEADLYLWIMQHRHSLRESTGSDPGAEAATLDYAARFGRRSLLGTVGEAAHAIATAAGNLLAGTPPRPIPEAEALAPELLEFMEWSRMGVLCPDVDVTLSSPVDYQRLRRHIEDHRYHLGLNWNRDVSLDEAVTDWCAYFYGPTAAAIREQGVLADWPGHTEADLYLEAMEQLERMREQGQGTGPTDALASLHEQAGKRETPMGALVRGALRLLRFRR